MKNDKKIIAKNPVAYHNYEIIDTIETGIVLYGTEIKSIRNGKSNLKDSYAIIRNGEVYVINMFVSNYDKGNIYNKSETRSRKLLLHKNEILKLNNDVQLKGLTLIPLKLYFNGEHLKVLLGVCKGKKLYDKRESIKERDIKRENEKANKYRY